MRKLLLVPIILFFACSQNKEAELKENLAQPIETFVTSKLGEGEILDSVIITYIDTVTPLVIAHDKYTEISNEYLAQSQLFIAQQDLFIREAKKYKYKQSLWPAGDPYLVRAHDLLMEEEKQVDDMELLYKELLAQVEELEDNITSNSIDSTTFLNYQVIAKITMTQPDMIQETKELVFWITKDFKILKRN